MKPLQFTLVLLLACLGESFSQTSNMEGRQWTVMIGPSFGSPDITTHTYKTEDVEELDGQYYSRVWVDYHSNGVWILQGGLLREDSLKRVYYRTTSATQERLLYDFTLEKGNISTVFVPEHGTECTGVVDSVDFVQTLDGGMRKRILFEPRFEYDGQYYWENVWLEGAGSVHGPLISYACVTDYDAFLLCYFEDDDQVFGPLGNCVVTSEVSVPATTEPVIYPNPTSNIIHITTARPIDFIEIWSARGVRLQYAEGNLSELSLAPYAPGIYLLRIRYTDGQVYLARVVRTP